MTPLARLVVLAAFGLGAGCSGGDGGAGPSNPRPSSLAVAAGNNQSVTAGAAVTVPPAVLVRDQHGDPLPGVSVAFVAQPGNGSVTGGNATTNQSGIATVGGWTLPTAAGAHQLVASVGDLPALIFTATATAGPTAALAFLTPPGGTTFAGAAFPTAPVLEIQDAFGNPRPQAGIQVTAAIATGGGSLVGSATALSSASGSVTFTGLGLAGTVGIRTLTFTVAGVPGLISGPIQVNPGSPATVAAVGSTTLAGGAGGPAQGAVTVLVQDGSGNPVPNAGVSFVVTAGGGALIGSSQQTDAQGQATLGGWTLGPTVGLLNTLEARVPGLAPVVFSATPGTPGLDILVLTTPPSTTAASGASLAVQPVVAIRDQLANPVPLAGVTVTATVTSGNGVASGGTSAVTDANGSAAFSGLAITGLVGPYILTFSAPGLTGVTTSTIALGAGAPTAMVALRGDGQTLAAGTAVPVLPAVVVTDAEGNGVPGLAVSFQVTGGGGGVTGSAATTNASGEAAVSSWTLGQVVGTNTLQATAAGLAGLPITFTATGQPGPVAGLSILTQPSAVAVNGVPLAQQPVLQVVDRFRNAVPAPFFSVTVSWSTGSVTVGSAGVDTDAQGVATFLALTIVGQVGVYDMLYSVNTPGLPALGGQRVTLVAGAASGITAVAGDGQVGTAGAAVGVPPAVSVFDVSGNPVSGATVAFAVASGGGSITGGTAQTDANGHAKVGSWTLGEVPGLNTLTATVAGLQGPPVTFTATGTPLTEFTIDLVFLSSATPAQQAAFAAAKVRWEAVITADLADFTIPQAFNTTDCGATTPQTIAGTVDDLRIYAEIVVIDGPGGILGAAGPCDLRNTGTLLPYVGIMQFDVADLAGLEADGSLADVVLHEMGHVLGYGVLWEPIPGFWNLSLLTGGCPSNTPQFTGAGAVAAYRTLNGGGTATTVPVEDSGTCSGSNGDGTRDSHWEETIFQSEVMTGFISGTLRPLSATSIRSIEDLGYQVDVTQADPFNIGTQPTLVLPGGVPRRLVGDARALPRWSVDTTGRRKTQYTRP